MVCHLINNGADVSNGGSFCGCPLSAAIDRGHWRIAQTLLDKGADVNGPAYSQVPHYYLSDFGIYGDGDRDFSRQPLNSAIYQDDRKMVVDLLGRGTNLNTIRGRCRSASLTKHWLEEAHPLCHALELNRMAIVDILLAKGADIAIGNFCPLLTALSMNNLKAFETFMTANTEAMLNSFLEEMLFRCSQDDSIQAVLKLIENKSPDHTFEEPGPLLRRAIMCDSNLMLSWLLKRGLSPNISLCSKKFKELGHEYALPTAIERGHYNNVEMLLANPVDVNLCDSDRGTAIYAAVKQKNKEMIQKLISLGARFEEPIWSYKLCWIFAHRVAFKGDVGTMDFIYSNGASIVDQCDLCGSVLGHAVEVENIEMIRYLVSKGCDFNELNVYGMPLLKWAEDRLLDDACTELRRLGATNTVDQRKAELQVEQSVSRLCEDLSGRSATQKWPMWLSRRRWIMLGRCLLLGDDLNNALIALEQTMHFDEGIDGKSRHLRTKFSCARCGRANSSRYHLCRDSTDMGICENTCLKLHEQELRLDEQLDDHAHLMYPRPFFSADIPKDYVALDETYHIPREEWLESLKDWKVKTAD